VMFQQSTIAAAAGRDRASTPSKPAAPRACAGREAVTVPDIPAGHALLAGITIGDAADLRRGDVTPSARAAGSRGLAATRQRWTKSAASSGKRSRSLFAQRNSIAKFGPSE
jgi:hypothetical protein